MLIRLENGDWVDPSTVKRVMPLAGSPGFKSQSFALPAQPPRVAVHHGEGCVSILDVELPDDLQETADRIAAQINEALEVTR